MIRFSTLKLEKNTMTRELEDYEETTRTANLLDRKSAGSPIHKEMSEWMNGGPKGEGGVKEEGVGGLKRGKELEERVVDQERKG